MHWIYGLTAGVALLTGCCGGSMNKQWKGAMKELQITPVMPLRQKIEVGEVYRYLRKPSKFWKDGQVEPICAFRIPIDPSMISSNAVQFPEMTLSSSDDLGLKIPIEGITTVSGSHGQSRNVSIKVEGAYCLSANVQTVRTNLGIDSVASALENEFEGTRFYHNPIFAWKNLWPGNWGNYYKREIVWLRVPVAVYYATNLTVTVTNSFTNSFSGNISESLPVVTNYPGAKWTRVGNTSVGVKKLDPPMALGYRGLLFKVYLGAGDVSNACRSTSKAPKPPISESAGKTKETKSATAKQQEVKPPARHVYTIEEWLEGQ